MKGEAIPGEQGRKSTLLGHSPHPQEGAPSTLLPIPHYITLLAKDRWRIPQLAKVWISPPHFLSAEMNPWNFVSTHSLILPIATVTQLFGSGTPSAIHLVWTPNSSLGIASHDRFGRCAGWRSERLEVDHGHSSRVSSLTLTPPMSFPLCQQPQGSITYKRKAMIFWKK